MGHLYLDYCRFPWSWLVQQIKKPLTWLPTVRDGIQDVQAKGVTALSHRWSVWRVNTHRAESFYVEVALHAMVIQMRGSVRAKAVDSLGQCLSPVVWNPQNVTSVLLLLRYIANMLSSPWHGKQVTEYVNPPGSVCVCWLRETLWATERQQPFCSLLVRERELLSVISQRQGQSCLQGCIFIDAVVLENK